MFSLGFVVGAFVAGAVFVMFVPPKYEDWARAWLVEQWKKLTS